MTFGGQTVAFVTVTRGDTPGYLGLAVESRTAVTVSGCRFRPMPSTEQPEGATDVASEMWKCTAPPEAAALAAQSTGELIYDGTTTPTIPDAADSTVFRIFGPAVPKYDRDGQIHHVTIMAKRWAG